MNDYDDLDCTACTRDVTPEDMCWCRHPICWLCHDDGGHHWPGDEVA